MYPRLDLPNTASGVAFSVNASKIVNVYGLSKRLLKYFGGYLKNIFSAN